MGRQSLLHPEGLCARALRPLNAVLAAALVLSAPVAAAPDQPRRGASANPLDALLQPPCRTINELMAAYDELLKRFPGARLRELARLSSSVPTWARIRSASWSPSGELVAIVYGQENSVAPLAENALQIQLADATHGHMRGLPWVTGLNQVALFWSSDGKSLWLEGESVPVRGALAIDRVADRAADRIAERKAIALTVEELETGTPQSFWTVVSEAAARNSLFADPSRPFEADAISGSASQAPAELEARQQALRVFLSQAVSRQWLQPGRQLRFLRADGTSWELQLPI